MLEEEYNCISKVLRSQGRSNRWLAEQLGKNEVTISRWCKNKQQPKLKTIFKIAGILNVDPRELLNVKEEEI